MVFTHNKDKVSKEAFEQNNSQTGKNRNFTKKFLQSRGFISLLEKKRAEDLKLWQSLEAHYTDLLHEQVVTARKIDYLQSLANFGHNNVRKVYLCCIPLNIIVFGLLCLISPSALYDLHVDSPNIFRALIWWPLALSITNIPLFIYVRRRWHDFTYRKIQDRLGLLIFKYFEIVDKDKHIDGGYTKKDITDILKRFNPKMPYSGDEIANYLQRIFEVEIDRKPRGIVYYIYFKEKYFDAKERARQTDTSIVAK